jgi:N6-adenosine-specific RNA methylase IME4/predicted transcriptional regulator
VEREALRADIEANGIREAVVVDEDTGAILDGHHRAELADALGLDYPTRPLRCNTDAERKAYSLRANLNRRNLSSEQRAELRAVQIGVARELRDEKRGQEEIAALLGVVQQTVSDWLSDDLDISDTVTGKANIDLRVSVPRDHREDLYERFAAGESQAQIAADYHITQGRVSQIVKQVEARRNTPQPVVETPKWPTGPFRCITLDPPWPMPKIEREERPNQGVTLDYPTMAVDCGHDEPNEDRDCCIKAIPIEAMADQRGAHIYLWVTHKFLPAGLDLFEAWGVRYQCLMTWRKNVGPTPFSWMYDTEHVLFGRIGSLGLDRNGLRLSFDAPVAGHSVKPNIFYERVAEASPGERLALFERGSRPGFMAWGNEVGDASSGTA